MTSIEALTLLRQSNVKVKREHWAKDEFVQSFAHNMIRTSKTYDDKRCKNCHYPDDTAIVLEWLWEDLMADDWEVVE